MVLASEFRRWRPQLVMGFGAKTPMASPDHWQAMQITDAAIFYSRLTKWDEYFGGLPVHTISRHLHYRLAVEPDTIFGHTHHLTVDVTETIAAKLASIECYQTQFSHKPGILERVRGQLQPSQGQPQVVQRVSHSQQPNRSLWTTCLRLC